MSKKRRIYNILVLGILRALPTSWVDKLSDELLRLRFRTQELLRQRWARNTIEVFPNLYAFNGEIITRSILEKRSPWDDLQVTDCTIPGMLTESEKLYYSYITKFYSGSGVAVELGPWLGLSTYYIVSGLLLNPHFKDKKLYVYDDFIWRSSWMDKWLKGTNIPLPMNHSSFKDLFVEQLGDLTKYLTITRQKISDYDGNESLPLIEWNGGPIELIVVDCGRTLSVNEGWWNVFNSSFVKDKTLIIMQDWQNHKWVPELFWENTKIFTDSKLNEIESIHEVRNAGIATFLYRGKVSS